MSRLQVISNFIVLISCFGVQSNLLFIVLDDLRPDFTIYGNKNSLTPNFERLAKNSMSFEHANAQISASDPSKMSLFTGLRPDTTNIYNDFQPQNLPQLILPTLLSRLGYKTVEIGTVFPSNGILNENIWDAQFSALKSPSNVEGKGKNAVMHEKQSTEADYPDYQYASHVIEAIKGFKQSKDLFLIAVSFDLKVASHKLKDHSNENQIKSANKCGFCRMLSADFPTQLLCTGLNVASIENFITQSQHPPAGFITLQVLIVPSDFVFKIYIKQSLRWAVSSAQFPFSHSSLYFKLLNSSKL